MERDWDNEDDERIHETGEVAPGAGRLRPRRDPCTSCPYRRDVPSGVWETEEYDKLPDYDGDTSCQYTGVFMCHQADGYLCAGWVGHRDPYDLLALRLGVSARFVDPAVFDYRTDVPLFSSGAEAADHGRRDVERPERDARKMALRLLQVRARREDR